MRNCFFLVLAVLFCIHGRSQNIVPVHGTDVPLCCGLDTPYTEYSGMARWKNNVLLIPQYPDRWQDALFALDSANIEQCLNHQMNSVPYKKIMITNLDEVRKHMKGTYQGFEGAVVVGNTIFFTLEFTESTCYLLKGHMHQSGDSIFIDLQQPYPVQKLKHAYDNAGYESIGYVKGTSSLVIFFEKNSDPVQPSALLVDTSFHKKPVPVQFSEPMFFRLTDVAATGKNTFIGINYYYNDYHRKKNEYNYYVGDAYAAQATKQMNGAPVTDSNYTGIVELTLKGKQISWHTKKFISLGGENWEGILPFKDGVLMVVDEYPKDRSPRMRYFEW